MGLRYADHLFLFVLFEEGGGGTQRRKGSMKNIPGHGWYRGMTKAVRPGHKAKGWRVEPGREK